MSSDGLLCRSMTPGQGVMSRGDVVYHHDINRAKRSILLDLKRPEGLEVFWQLLEEAEHTRWPMVRVLLERAQDELRDRVGHARP